MSDLDLLEIFLTGAGIGALTGAAIVINGYHKSSTSQATKDMTLWEKLTAADFEWKRLVGEVCVNAFLGAGINYMIFSGFPPQLIAIVGGAWAGREQLTDLMKSKENLDKVGSDGSKKG